MKGLAPTPTAPRPTPELLGESLGYLEYCASLAGIWWSRHGGVPPAHLARRRLGELVRFARASAPFYRRLYRRLPGDVARLDALPVVRKANLMADFEATCTDPAVRLAELERHLADPARVGERFLGRYYAWKSSGSSGTPGMFVQDPTALAVYGALVGAQLAATHIALGRWAAAGGRAALVAATGDHFASITAWEHLRRSAGASARSFSVLAPLPRLVEELNAWRPAFLASYPSVLALLAAEQRAGRLALAPALVWSAGETLGDDARDGIAAAFGCQVVNEYGASECLSIAGSCPAGALHVNTEWVLLEPVDAEGRAVAPGGTSRTVLLTNLANRVQPILRYDLGDRVTPLAAPCPCGDPRPAIRVRGREGAVVALRTRAGRTVRLVPLALETVLEEALGARRFQLVQDARDGLRLRLDAGNARTAAFRAAARALHAYLGAQDLDNVSVALDPAAPRPDAASGKLAHVLREA